MKAIEILGYTKEDLKKIMGDDERLDVTNRNHPSTSDFQSFISKGSNYLLNHHSTLVKSIYKEK